MSDKWWTAWFAFCVVVGILWLCVLIWAVVSLVGWVTAQ